MIRTLLALTSLLATVSLQAQTNGLVLPADDIPASSTIGLSLLNDVALSPVASLGAVPGSFRGDLRPDPANPSTVLGTSTGGFSPFLSVYTGARAHVSTIALDGGDGEGKGAAFDATGNLFFTGYVSGGQVFLGGGANAPFTATDGADAFLVSYAPPASGASPQVRWSAGYDASNASGSSASDERFNAVAVSPTGTVWAVGRREPSQNGGASRLGIAQRYDAATGAPIGGAIQLGGQFNANSSIEAVATDAQGNVYLVGFFTGNMDVPGAPTNLGQNFLSSGSNADWFIISYTNGGGYRWAYSFGGTGASDGATSVTVGGSTVYVGGVLRDNSGRTQSITGSFGPSIGSGSGAEAGVVLAFSTAGSYLNSESFRIISTGVGTRARSTVLGLSYDDGILGVAGSYTADDHRAVNATNGVALGTDATLTHFPLGTSDSDGMVFLIDAPTRTVLNAQALRNTAPDEVRGIAIENGTAWAAALMGAQSNDAIEIRTRTATLEQSFARSTRSGPVSDFDAFIATFEGASLPVELSAFDAIIDGSDARLTWVTQSETSNEGFAIEHKADGAPDFARVGWVGGAGTTLEGPALRLYRVQPAPRHPSLPLAPDRPGRGVQFQSSRRVDRGRGWADRVGVATAGARTRSIPHRDRASPPDRSLSLRRTRSPRRTVVRRSPSRQRDASASQRPGSRSLRAARCLRQLHGDAIGRGGSLISAR